MMMGLYIYSGRHETRRYETRQENGRRFIYVRILLSYSLTNRVRKQYRFLSLPLYNSIVPDYYGRCQLMFVRNLVNKRVNSIKKGMNKDLHQCFYLLIHVTGQKWPN